MRYIYRELGSNKISQEQYGDWGEDEVYLSPTPKEYKHKSKTTQRYLKRMYERSGGGMVYAVSGVWYHPDKERFVRYYRGKRSKQIKKNCNRRLRKMQVDISNGGLYKKYTEFWWELY